MTTTTAELREKVARKLTISSSDMALEAEDTDRIDDRIGEVTSHLRERGLAWWIDNAIPDAAVLPMVMIVAYWAADDFGKTAGPTWARDGEALLASIKPSGVIETVKMEAF